MSSDLYALVLEVFTVACERSSTLVDSSENIYISKLLCLNGLKFNDYRNRKNKVVQIILSFLFRSKFYCYKYKSLIIFSVRRYLLS